MNLRLLCLSLLACGCSSLEIPRAEAPEAPTSQSKCSVAASSNPLVTEWPASEKANLEALLREGGVAVKYEGCEMRLLAQCRLPGRYTWLRTTSATDSIEIGNEDDLYAKLPLGAASLEAELRESGRLAMQTTVAGQMKLEGLSVDEVPRDGACRDATHVLSALSVGAFSLRSGGTLRAAGGVSTAFGGGSLGTRSSETLVREAGVPDACSASTPEAPHEECRSPLQVFLWPLPWVEAARPPDGMLKVAFTSEDDDERWEVVHRGRVLCTTPCEGFVDPNRSILIRGAKGGYFNDEVELSDLREHVAGAPLEVRTEGGSWLMWGMGLGLTVTGGALLAAGAAFAGAGCPRGDDGSAMCTAGIATLIPGTLMAVPGVVLLAIEGADADVLSIGVGPTTLTGRF